VSRRRERAGRRAPREASGQSPREASGAAPGEHGGAPGRRPPRLPFLTQVGILVAVFALGTLVAELFGAANLGVALGVGQICFAIALVVVIVKT
jgi:hypothetical protein